MPTIHPNPILYGHIAARIREAMAAGDWQRDRLARELGCTRGMVTHWVTARGAPSKTYRPKLAKVLGIPEVELMKRDPNVAAEPMKALPGPATAPARRVVTPEVLAFTIDQEGNARIKLDVTLPVMRGAALLRLLLDHGVAAVSDDHQER